MTSYLALAYTGGTLLDDRFQEVLDLFRDTYIATSGGYPALEWLDERPDPSAPTFESDFGEVYAPFLRYRLSRGLDAAILALDEDDSLLGMVGLDYDFSREEKSDLAASLQRLLRAVGLPGAMDRVGFIELLGVLPARWGQGTGGELVRRGVRELRRIGRHAYAVSFPGLEPALGLYRGMGAAEVGVAEGFRWEPNIDPTDYMVIDLNPIE